MKQNLRDALWGCLEIPLFMKIGAERFSNSSQAMKESFLVPFLLLPVAIFCSLLNPKMAEMPFLLMAFRYTMNTVLFMAIYYPLMYLICRKLDLLENFPRMVNGGNWLNLPGIILFLPFLGMVLAGWHSFEETAPFLVVIIMYGYAYGAYFITQVLKVNWMLGAGFSILAMFIGDITHTLVFPDL